MSGLTRSLPQTSAMATVGGVAVWQLGLVALAIGVVLAAAATIRFGWRRGRPVSVR